MTPFISQFAAESSSSGGIGALGVDPKAFIIQMITFVLAFLVLRKFAFKPIIAVMEQRRNTIETGVKLGEQLQKEKADLEKQVAKQLQEARVKADVVMADAETAASETIRDAEDKATEKAALIVKEGKARGEQEVVRARKALETELVSLISDATETIIGEKVDAKKDSELIDRALKGSRA